MLHDYKNVEDYQDVKILDNMIRGVNKFFINLSVCVLLFLIFVNNQNLAPRLVGVLML